MMDVSDAAKEPIVEREAAPKDDSESKAKGEDVDGGGGGRGGGAVGPESPGNGDRHLGNLKRSPDEDSTNSKKRRKQLKPIRIATNLEDMVKVPKQIIGLNNDLDFVNDSVPKKSGSKSRNGASSIDVRFSVETSAGRGGNDSGKSIDASRFLLEKPEMADLNVPNVETGPNYLTDSRFAFPLSFRTVKNPNFWSEANLKIFNQEAYCELCKKEFCNKYFLKTHKANKHGIYADVSPSSGGPRLAVSAKPEGKEPTKSPENGRSIADENCGTAFCDLCNKKFCNKYFARRHKNKSHGFSEEDVRASAFESNSKIVQNSLLDSTKETDSTLNNEKMLTMAFEESDYDDDDDVDEDVDRDEDDDDRCDRKKSEKQENVNREVREDDVEDDEDEDEEEEEDDDDDADDDEGPLNLIVTAKDDFEAEENAKKEKRERRVREKFEDGDDDCSSENIEKLETMLLRLNPSETESKTCKGCNDAVEGSGERTCKGIYNDKKEKDFSSETNDSSDDSRNDFGISKNETAVRHPPNRAERSKQSKPTSSYCEICNKELCNKYFMRTHMQRMHGIEIEHGTQIGGVVCNICNKELCSKYFLRVHKQNTHGITGPNSLPAPSTSSGNVVPSQRTDPKASRPDPRFPPSVNFSQVCHLCGKRFRSQKWLQAHVLSDHCEEEILKGDPRDESGPGLKIPREGTVADGSPEALDVISKIFWENATTSKTYACSRCPFATPVLAFLFVHERSHFVPTQDRPETIEPSSSLQNLVRDKTFWQHKITQQMPECLDLSAGKPNYVTFERNGS